MSSFLSRTLLVLFATVTMGACELVIDPDDSDSDGDIIDDGPIRDDPFVPSECADACCDACSMVGTCTDSQIEFNSCTNTCYQSQLVEPQGIECMALRIFWINEEGCNTIVDTYRTFDLADDCQE